MTINLTTKPKNSCDKNSTKNTTTVGNSTLLKKSDLVEVEANSKKIKEVTASIKEFTKASINFSASCVLAWLFEVPLQD
ncbi:MAG: hypothetical protein QXM75_03715 [Candidatus Diapherotrites archaeon]